MATATIGESAIDEDAEFLACSTDPGYFIDNHVVIENADEEGNISGVVPFNLWPYQIKALATIWAAKILVILKARQLGITWLCIGYALWLCTFKERRTVLLFSQGDLEAKELLRRIAFMYEQLPEFIRKRSPLKRDPSTSEIIWANGSRCRALPATPKAGRSFTAQLIIMDEAAHMAWGKSLYVAVKAAADRGGQLIILSTAYGATGFFYWAWRQTKKIGSRMVGIFLPWHSRPGRDEQWMENQRNEMEEDFVRQEFPENDMEAFLASGSSRFRPEWVERQVENVRDSIPLELWPMELRALDELKLYEIPSGRNYVISADVAEGLEDGDYSDAWVFTTDGGEWEEVASINGHWEPKEFAIILNTLSEAYSADIVVERNNHGHTVISNLNNLGCTRIAFGLDGRQGWKTDMKTKPQSIDLLAQALKEGTIVIHTEEALTEMKEYQRQNGKTGAPKGRHDDRVMSRAIGIAWIVMGGVGYGTIEDNPLPDLW